MVVILANLFDSTMELLIFLYKLCNYVLDVVGRWFVSTLESDGDLVSCGSS